MTSFFLCYYHCGAGGPLTLARHREIRGKACRSTSKQRHEPAIFIASGKVVLYLRWNTHTYTHTHSYALGDSLCLIIANLKRRILNLSFPFSLYEREYLLLRGKKKWSLRSPSRKATSTLDIETPIYRRHLTQHSRRFQLDASMDHSVCTEVSFARI